ncbi:hypothetical protein FRC08_015876 [Ceratobasidium sp. 394]|nr:hypothetical protein FRC08_015876 [Ceratobasidium sp. 394]KAG9089319.1 hypothetical protein FS749_001424 [Ceratobasidium sp. UAMH 11750]
MAHDIPRDLGKTEKLAALDEIATERLGGLTLKSWQGEAVCELLTGNDVLLLAPTGAGKSLLFYLYALARPTEVVLVVSPLKMLEKNMVSKH